MLILSVISCSLTVFEQAEFYWVLLFEFSISHTISTLSLWCHNMYCVVSLPQLVRLILLSEVVGLPTPSPVPASGT